MSSCPEKNSFSIRPFTHECRFWVQKFLHFDAQEIIYFTVILRIQKETHYGKSCNRSAETNYIFLQFDCKSCSLNYGILIYLTTFSAVLFCTQNLQLLEMDPFCHWWLFSIICGDESHITSWNDRCRSMHITLYFAFQPTQHLIFQNLKYFTALFSK